MFNVVYDASLDQPKPQYEVQHCRTKDRRCVVNNVVYDFSLHHHRLGTVVVLSMREFACKLAHCQATTGPVHKPYAAVLKGLRKLVFVQRLGGVAAQLHVVVLRTTDNRREI